MWASWAAAENKVTSQGKGHGNDCPTMIIVEKGNWFDNLQPVFSVTQRTM